MAAEVRVEGRGRGLRRLEEGEMGRSRKLREARGGEGGRPASGLGLRARRITLARDQERREVHPRQGILGPGRGRDPQVTPVGKVPERMASDDPPQALPQAGPGPRPIEDAGLDEHQTAA